MASLTYTAENVTTRRESRHAASIRNAPTYRPRFDVRLIESYMRMDLTGQAVWQFASEVARAIACIEAAGLAAEG